jgi:hypothetical protein
MEVEGQQEITVEGPELTGEEVSPVGESGEGGEGGVPTAPEYEPNFEFSVMDQKREIDDWARPLITDSDSEARVRDLYERAYGLDVVKQDRDTLRQHNQQLMQQVGSLGDRSALDESFKKHGDLGGFLKHHGWSEDQLIAHAIERVKLAEATPEERVAYEQQTQARSAAAQMELENSRLRDQVQHQAVQQREFELNMALGNPQTAQIAQEYDQRVGQPGAFRNMVVQTGAFYGYQGQDLPVGNVIHQTIQNLGLQPAATGVGQPGAYGRPQPGGYPQAPGYQQPFAPAAPVAPQPGQRVPVIPKVQGSGHSPVKQSPRSINDIRRLAQEANS